MTGTDAPQMWAYQQHFAFFLKYYMEAILREQVKRLEVAISLIGVPRDTGQALALESENDVLTLADIDGVLARRDQLLAEEPAFDGHTHRPQGNPRDRATGRAIKEAISRKTGGDHLAFIGWPVAVGDYSVYCVAMIANAEYDNLAHHKLFCRALIKMLLDEARAKLLEPEPGKHSLRGFTNRGTGDICRATGKHVLEVSLSTMFGSFISLTETYTGICQLAAQLHENREAHGQLCFLPWDEALRSLTVRFHRPLDLRAARAVRKILDMSSKSYQLVASVQALEAPSILGLAVRRPLGVRIEVAGNDRWSLYRDEDCLMHVVAGVPSLGISQERFSDGHFEDRVRHIFPEMNATDMARARKIVLAALRQERGTTLVFRRDAAGESQRLTGNQGILLDPVQLTPELVHSLSSIDGALIVDLDGRCHAAGVILDGTATKDGSVDRGARFNSAVRYVASQPSCVTVVFSEDGQVDILPDPTPGNLPLDEDLSLLEKTDAQTYEALLWLDKHRLYLTSEDRPPSRDSAVSL